ncbi:unnamed protein product [Closterium sp. NIES-53]
MRSLRTAQDSTVEDLVSHLLTSDARYRATVPAEFLDGNQPPMFITLYFIVTRLPNSLRSVRDHFLSLDPASLTVDLLEEHLLVAETSAVVVGAARGTPRLPFFEGCSPSPLASSYACASAADDSMVTTTTPGGQRVSICTCTRAGRHLATFTRRIGSKPPLPPLPAPPCLPCVKGWQRAAPHSSSFPPTCAPMQTLHMDVSGLAYISEQGRQRYFLLVVDDNTRYTTVFHLRSKEVVSSPPTSDLCRGEGITQSFMLLASPQQNGIAERRIGLPRVSLPETSPTLRWIGEAGDASVFRVCGSRAFVRDTFVDKLSARAIRWVFLGFVPDPHGWQFYHPTSSRVFPSQDVTFDESVPFYRLFPYRSAPPLPPPLFLALGPPPLDPLPPQGPAPPDVSQVEPLPGPAPVEVAVGSSVARGAAYGGSKQGGLESEGVGSGGAEPWDEEPGGAEPEGVELGDDEPEGVELGGAESEGAESGGAEPQGAALSEGLAGASPRLSPQQLLTAGAGGTGGAVAAGSGGARTRGIGAAGTSGVGSARAGDPTEPGAAGAGVSGAGGAGAEGGGAGGIGAGGSGAGGAGAGGTGVGGTSTGGAGAGGAGAVDPGGIVRPRAYFVPLIQQVLGVPSPTGLTPALLCPPPDQSQLPLPPASPLPAPSPYTKRSGGLTECREPASRPVLPIRTAHCGPRSRPHPVPGTHAMAHRPSSVPLRVSLPAPPESSRHEVPNPHDPGTHAMAHRPSSVPLRVPLPGPPESSRHEIPNPESDRARATSPTVSCFLATTITNPSFESSPASALIAELLDFAAAFRLDYATALVAESAFASPPSVGGECALGTDVLEDRQEDFECLAVAVPRFASMLLALEGDPDAPIIPTPRSYAEAITGPYSSQWQAAMDAEMASWKSTGSCVDAVPPPEANIVDGMWIFRHSFPIGQSARGDLAAPPTWLHWVVSCRTTLAALGFAPSTADPSLFLHTDTSLPPLYVLLYVDDLVFAIANTKTLTLVKSELQKRHTCSDLGELRSYLGLQITWDTTRCTITLTQSHMLHQVLQHFGFQFSSPQPTPLSTSHSLSAPPSDESVELNGPYQELVGCLMYLMTCTQPDLAYPLSLLARYVAPGRHRKGYTFSLGFGSVSCRSTCLSSVLSSNCEAEIYAGAMVAQELRWLTYLPID